MDSISDGVTVNEDSSAGVVGTGGVDDSSSTVKDCDDWPALAGELLFGASSACSTADTSSRFSTSNGSVNSVSAPSAASRLCPNKFPLQPSKENHNDLDGRVVSV